GSVQCRRRPRQSADARLANDISCLRRYKPGLVWHRERPQLVFGNCGEHHDGESEGTRRSAANEKERESRLSKWPGADPGKHRRFHESTRLPQVATLLEHESNG